MQPKVCLLILSIFLGWIASSPVRNSSPTYAAVLLRSPGSKVFCSGVLTGPQQVLTARHCLKSPTDLDFFIEFGAGIDGSTRYTARPNKIRFADLGTAAFPLLDVAEISFEGELPQHITPIPLLEPSTKLNSATPMTVVGFGHNGLALPSLVQYQNSYDGDRIFGIFTAQSTDLKNGPCFGDSGGGAFVLIDGKWHLSGLVIGVWDIFGKERCGDGSVVFSDIRPYKSWLRGGPPPGPKPLPSREKTPFGHLCKTQAIASPAWGIMQQIINAVALENASAHGHAPVEAFQNCSMAESWLSDKKRPWSLTLRGIEDLSPLRTLPNLTELTLIDIRNGNWNDLQSLTGLHKLSVRSSQVPLPWDILLSLPLLTEIKLDYLTVIGHEKSKLALQARGKLTLHEVEQP